MQEISPLLCRVILATYRHTADTPVAVIAQPLTVLAFIISALLFR
jgi:hypothetical protein